LMADPNARLVALADAFADYVERCVEILEKSQVADRVMVDRDHRFAGFDAYQKLIDSGVDVVLLAAPPHFRPAHLKACVEAGKHVFAEKPVAVDAPGIRTVLAASEEAKRKGLSIVSGLMYRYERAKQETMKRVHDGAIGDIVAIQTTYNCGPPWFRNKPRRPGWTEMEYQMRNWYPFTWLSGDHNVEQHVHSLDKAAWALHDQPPEKAWGSGGRQVRMPPAIGNIFDHHCVTYEFANGIRVYSHCRRQAGCSNDISDYILGTKGRCDVMKHRIEGQTEWQYEGPNPNKYVVEHEALFNSIRTGRPINNGHYMAYSTMWAIMGRMATYTGQTIRWDQAMGSQEDLSPERYAWDADPPILPDENGNYPLAVPGVTKFI
ncbi:MAG TPA: Gfo/Idh/MocA family oxidoreductase, partial [Planctomycetes bacterium]|nr:Gfo/Idh/MocA family oxidoreductase [Planctomycetota bacterium]